MKILWILAMKELRDGLRNRWIAAAIIVLGTLALALSLLGSAPTGSIKASPMDISVISLASLSVYLIPLIALMLSFDTLVGEFERGTMMLLLTYPVTRWQVIIGKFLGHLIFCRLRWCHADHDADHWRQHGRLAGLCFDDVQLIDTGRNLHRTGVSG